MNLQIMQSKAARLLEELNPFCKRIEIAGSIRRQKPQVKDIEIVAIIDRVKLYDLHGWFRNKRVIKGHPGGKYIQFEYDSVMVDMFMTTPECWGCIFLIRTGSNQHNHLLMQYARRNNMKFDKGRLYIKGILQETPEEADVFRHMRLPYTKPTMREGFVAHPISKDLQ